MPGPTMRPLTDVERAKLGATLERIGGTKQFQADTLGVSRLVVTRALAGEPLQLAKRIRLVGREEA